MTDNSNEKQTDLAKANVQESNEAVRLAREAQERDRLAGVPTNPAEVLSGVAKSIKGKLERNEFKVAVDENGNQVPARPADKE